MSVGSADLMEAIVVSWDEAELDDQFTDNWGSGDVGNFPVLHDAEATGEQPFPYCVYIMGSPSVVSRMSGIETNRREIRDVPFEFHVQAKATDADDAKTVAAGLAAAIMAQFGGHPKELPGDLTLANGNALIAQYTNDFGVQTGDDEYQWNINYIFKIDVPVAA